MSWESVIIEAIERCWPEARTQGKEFKQKELWDNPLSQLEGMITHNFQVKEGARRKAFSDRIWNLSQKEGCRIQRIGSGTYKLAPNPIAVSAQDRISHVFADEIQRRLVDESRNREIYRLGLIAYQERTSAAVIIQAWQRGKSIRNLMPYLIEEQKKTKYPFIEESFNYSSEFLGAW